MNQLAVLLLGAAALLAHMALTVLATPLLLMAGEASTSRAGWRTRLVAPVRGLGFLARKEPLRSDSASGLPEAAPVAALGLTVAAALLVPSFATGMLDWPLADLPLILALLVASRSVWLAAACDAGLAGTGLAAMGGIVDGLLVLPGLVLAATTLFLSTGSTVLDTILSGQRGVASPGGLACATALALAALGSGGRDAILCAELSGPDLAVFRIEAALRRLVWIDLVGGLFWPGSLAPAQSGPLHWLLAVLAWLARLAVAAIVLPLLGELLRRMDTRRRLAGFCLLAALLAPILVLAGQKPG